jgi:hypothetical protein
MFFESLPGMTFMILMSEKQTTTHKRWSVKLKIAKKSPNIASLATPKSAGQVCRPGLPARSAGQVCRPGLPARSAGQVCRPSFPNNNKAADDNYLAEKQPQSHKHNKTEICLFSPYPRVTLLFQV